MDMTESTFASGERKLRYRLFGSSAGDAGRRAVLFVHGWNSSQAGYKPRAERVSRTINATCLTFDLSGHGDDAANLSQYEVHHHLQDVIAAYDHLDSCPGVDHTRVGVSGASYGGYLAVLLTACRPVKRLVLRAPTIENYRLPTGQLSPAECDFGPEGFNSLKLISQYRGDALIIESERDDVVPASVIAAYLRACPAAQHQEIPGATHRLTDRTWNEIFVKSLIDWFKGL